MKEGIFPFTVIKPLIKPRRTPTLNVRNGVTNKFIPILTSNTYTNAVYDIIDPTDRSNSPQIISRPMPRATMPKSGISFERDDKFFDEIKRCSGESKEKSTIKTINIIKRIEDL
jgi:hypothetical protein